MSGNDPMDRITRREDDIYMLYTGGTTGMPKGVMYNMGGLTQSFVASTFPTLGLGLPGSAEETAGLVRQAIEAGATSFLFKNIDVEIDGRRTAARVTREVRNKLTTGLKNPRRQTEGSDP